MAGRQKELEQLLLFRIAGAHYESLRSRAGRHGMQTRLQRLADEQITAQGRLSSAASQCWCMVQGLKSLANSLAQLELDGLTRSVQRFAKRRLAEALAGALRTWGCQAVEAQRLRTRAGLVECKQARGAMRAVLRTVLGYAAERRRLRRAASRIAARQSAASWGRWLSGIREAQRVRARARKAEGRWRPSWLGRAFTTWMQRSSEEKRLRRIGERIEMRQGKRVAWVGLVMWRAALEHTVRDAVRCRRWYVRWQRRQLRRAVRGWEHTLLVRGKMRIQVRRAAEKRGSTWQELQRWAVATEHTGHEVPACNARVAWPIRCTGRTDDVRPNLVLGPALATPASLGVEWLEVGVKKASHNSVKQDETDLSDGPRDTAPKFSSPLQVLKLRGMLKIECNSGDKCSTCSGDTWKGSETST